MTTQRFIPQPPPAQARTPISRRPLLPRPAVHEITQVRLRGTATSMRQLTAALRSTLLCEVGR